MRAVQRGRQSGAVLVLVLWVLGMLSLLLVTFLASNRTETSIAANTVSRVKLRAAAEGVIAWLSVYRTQQEEGLEPLQGEILYRQWQGDNIRFQVIPESSFVSLNAAPVELFEILLSNLGVEESDAQGLAAAIVDWRDPDDNELPGGAEADTYAIAGLHRKPTNRPFASLYELKNVKGMTTQLVEALEPWITVVGNHSTVNPRFAAPQLLELLGADPAAIPAGERMDRLAAESLVAANEFFALSDSGAYRLQLEISSPTNRAADKIEATVSFGIGEDLYLIQHWNEYTARFELAQE